MLSSRNIKLVGSLHQKKQRDASGLYIIEGDKMVREYLLSGEAVKWLFAKPEWISSLPPEISSKVPNTVPVSYEELKKISSLKTPHNALALVSTREYSPDITLVKGKLSIALDNIQDPGNLGTIVRLAGWFGIDDIFCSKGCVDVYNPKVTQATMGALLHTRVHYTDLAEILPAVADAGIPVYATTLEGESIFESQLPQSAMILFGNESKGISRELMKFVSHQLLIPSFGTRGAGIDSLNVGMSVAVVCSQFRSRSVSPK